MATTSKISHADLHAIAAAIAAAEASGQPSEATPLPDGYVPRSRDVCCGRGKRNWNHEGNVWFRNLIQANVDRYIQAPSKTDKTAVVVAVVEQVRSEGAFFVKQDDDSGRWYDIGDTQAREKVGHSLRDQVTAQKKKEKEGDSISPPRSRTPPQQVSQNFMPVQQVAGHQSNSSIAQQLVNQQAVASMISPQMVFSLPPAAVGGMNSIGITPDLSQSIDFLYGNSQPYSNVQGQHVQSHQVQQLHADQLQDLQPTPIHPQLQHQFRNMYQQPLQSNVQQPNRMPPPQNPDYGYGEVDYYPDQTRKTRDDHDLLDRRSSRDSIEVLQKFGRRPSWRAMSISSSSAKGLVNDMQELQAEFGDDLFDDYVFDRRRSSIQPFSLQTGAVESRRMSAMSMGSAMGESFGDLDSVSGNTPNVQFSNNFRSSIRRSSVNWMKEVQQQFQELDRLQAGEAAGPSSGGSGRRASAYDMLKVLQDMDYHDDD